MGQHSGPARRAYARAAAAAGGILHVLFPHVRAELLRLLFGDTQREWYVRELTRETTMRLSTVQQELQQLSQAGLVTCRATSYRKYYRANKRHRVASALAGLVIAAQSSDGSETRPFVSERKRPRRALARFDRKRQR